MELRKKLLSVAALAFATALSAGVAVSAGAEEANKSDDNFKISGVSVRFDDPAKENDGSGIRFKVDTPDSWTKETVEDAYTMITLAPKTGDYAGKTTSAKVSAQVWRDETGWNTVLVNIPEADYTTEVTAQAFVVFGGEVYETDSVSYSLAEAASIAMNNKNALDDRLTGYVVGVESVSLDKETLSLKDGETARLVATVAPAEYAVVWFSDDTSVATVDKNGNVTAKKAGTANITAQMGGKEATCAVTVAYKANYDFEDGTVCSIFAPKTNEQISVDTYNGSNVLKMYVESGSAPGMYISADYLAWAFADTSVQSLSFDLTLASAVSSTNKVALNKKLAGAAKEQVDKAFTIGETRTITITRADYEGFVADTSENAGEWLYYWSSKSADDAMAWYVDNVSLLMQEEKYQSAYDFENGVNPGIFTAKTSEEISVETYNGSNALKMHVEYAANAGMYISADYLAWAFADSSVQSLSFDLTLVSAVQSDDTTVEKVTLYRKLASATKEQVGKAVAIGETRTITITREEYEVFAADTSDKAGEWSYYWNKSASYAMTWYVDNVTVAK